MGEDEDFIFGLNEFELLVRCPSEAIQWQLNI